MVKVLISDEFKIQQEAEKLNSRLSNQGYVLSTVHDLRNIILEAVN
jgi:hypothetical protein